MLPASPQRDMPDPVPDPDSGAGTAALEEEPVLVVEPLEPSSAAPRRRGIELRPLLNAVSLALLLVLLLAGGVTVVRLRSSGGARPTVASRVQIAVLPAVGQGWDPAGTPAAQDIAFAPSAPTTAYDCGAPTLSPSVTPVPIAVASSRDGGRTWRTLPSPTNGVICGLTVNPTDPLDVVLMVSPSSAFATAPIALFRTFDGGNTWARWPFPPRLGAPHGAPQYTGWAWAGSTLFLAPYYPAATGYTDLAASIAGQPLTWVQQNGLFARAPSDASINQLLGTSTTLYVVLFSQNACANHCARVLASADGGASWTLQSPTFHGRSVNLLAQSADGRTLFGSYFDDPAQANMEYVSSRDGGATWLQLTPLPAESIASDMFATPDGTFYAVLDTNPAALNGAIEPRPGIYRLAPGASTWTFVAPPVNNSGAPVVVSWDAAGHPLSLWSNIHASLADGTQPGLQRHPA